MPKEFLDTNVLVYSVDLRDPVKCATARRLLQTCGTHSGVLSTQVLQEFYVTVTRKETLSSSDALAFINALTRFEVVPIDVPAIQRAVSIHQQHKISFWDALIIASAEKGGCRLLWSEDLQDGQVIAGIRIRNPFGIPGPDHRLVRETRAAYSTGRTRSSPR